MLNYGWYLYFFSIFTSFEISFNSFFCSCFSQYVMMIIGFLFVLTYYTRKSTFFHLLILQLLMLEILSLQMWYNSFVVLNYYKYIYIVLSFPVSLFLTIIIILCKVSNLQRSCQVADIFDRPLVDYLKKFPQCSQQCNK